MSYEEYLLAGRNVVLEALRAGKHITRVWSQWPRPMNRHR